MEAIDKQLSSIYVSSPYSVSEKQTPKDALDDSIYWEIFSEIRFG